MRRLIRFQTLNATVMIFAAAITVLISACSNTTTETKPPINKQPVASPSVSPSASPSPSGSPNAIGKKTEPGNLDNYVGKWTGPEGTYLNITKKGDKYSIEIANLDGSKTYEGTAKGDQIEFLRKGKVETIKTATGSETGMKDLAAKQTCLVIAKGTEGFCRD